MATTNGHNVLCIPVIALKTNLLTLSRALFWTLLEGGRGEIKQY